MTIGPFKLTVAGPLPRRVTILTTSASDGTGNPEKFHVLGGDVRLVFRRNQERRNDEKGLARVIQHLKPHKRLLAGILEKDVILDAFKSEKAERKLNNIFVPYGTLFRLNEFSGFHCVYSIPADLSKGHAMGVPASF